MFRDPLGREPGTPLDETRHTKSELEIRINANPRVGYAVWQQSPRQATGNLIDTTKFNRVAYSEVPTANMTRIRAWDLAFSEKEIAQQDPDYTSSCLMGLWQEGDNYAFYIYNITRWRRSWPETKNKIREYGLSDGIHTRIALEGGGPQKGLGESLRNEKLFAPFSIDIIPAMADKVARAQYWVDKLGINKIYLVIDDYIKPFVSECEAFPYGKHDDQVDAVSLAFFALMEYLKSPSITTVKVKNLYGKRK